MIYLKIVIALTILVVVMEQYIPLVTYNDNSLVQQKDILLNIIAGDELPDTHALPLSYLPYTAILSLTASNYYFCS